MADIEAQQTHLYYKVARQPEPCQHQLETLTHRGSPYYKFEEFFAYGPDIYALLYWKTHNRKQELHVCTATLWRANCTWNEMLEEVPDDVRTEISNGIGIEHASEDKMMVEIRHAKVIEYLIGKGLDQIVHGFTTNDVMAFSSFTFTQRTGNNNSPRCVEHSVMCMAKTRLNMVHAERIPSAALKNIAMTSSFVQPHALLAIVNGAGNDTRFDKNIPPHLGESDKREYKLRQLAAAREEIKGMDADLFKNRYLAWLELNYTLDPTDDPAIFQEVGRCLLMDKDNLEAWDELAGLLFLLATSKLLAACFHTHMALATDPRTFIAEVTPHDAKYGIKPPDGKRLDYVATPEGRLWFLGLLSSHAPHQNAFVERLDCALKLGTTAGNDEAFQLLTDGLRRFQHGMLGLVKRIYLNIIHDRINFAPAVQTRVNNRLMEYQGLDDAESSKKLDWSFVYPGIRTGAYRDPYLFFSSIGQRM